MRHFLLMLAVLAALPLMACNTKYLGEGCAESNEFCDSDLTCEEKFPGGFCTKPCSPRGDAAACPMDSLCVQESGQLMCAPVCTGHEQCRAEEGYECSADTGSSVRVCRLKQQTGTSTP